MIHHQDDWLTVYLGDCREVLATLPADYLGQVLERNRQAPLGLGA